MDNCEKSRGTRLKMKDTTLGDVALTPEWFIGKNRLQLQLGVSTVADRQFLCEMAMELD